MCWNCTLIYTPPSLKVRNSSPVCRIETVSAKRIWSTVSFVLLAEGRCAEGQRHGADGICGDGGAFPSCVSWDVCPRAGSVGCGVPRAFWQGTGGWRLCPDGRDGSPGGRRTCPDVQGWQRGVCPRSRIALCFRQSPFVRRPPA